MNRIPKIIFSGTTILLLFLLAVSQICMAEESIPLLPMTVKGMVLLNGAPAPDGTSVVADMNGQPVGKHRVISSSGEYCIWISGTAADRGKPVIFSVDGRDTGESIPWESGRQVLSLDLSAGVRARPGDSTNGLYSLLNSGMLSEIGKLRTFGKRSETRIIENSVPEPNLEALKDIKINSDKRSAESSDGSSKLNSAPGFPVIYAIAGMFGLALGCNFKRKSKKT